MNLIAKLLPPANVVVGLEASSKKRAFEQAGLLFENNHGIGRSTVYDSLFARIADWLKPDGKLFVHIFCHRQLMYPFETEGEDNWMGRYFFTGGLMPSADTLVDAQTHLPLEQRWLLPGTHYQRTADHWLANQDGHRDEVLAVLREAYGDADARRWHQRWRMFWMACAELFGYDEGREWQVAHYLFAKP